MALYLSAKIGSELFWNKTSVLKNKNLAIFFFFCMIFSSHINGVWQFFQHQHALEVPDFQYLDIKYFPNLIDYS